MQRIDWQTPADILERIIRYEAVHEIQDWDDLRRRVEPDNRRCFAFFHPALIDEPLIFVEVALSNRIPSSIDEILSTESEAAQSTRLRRGGVAGLPGKEGGAAQRGADQEHLRAG